MTNEKPRLDCEGEREVLGSKVSLGTCYVEALTRAVGWFRQIPRNNVESRLEGLTFSGRWLVHTGDR